MFSRIITRRFGALTTATRRKLQASTLPTSAYGLRRYMASDTSGSSGGGGSSKMIIVGGALIVAGGLTYYFLGSGSSKPQVETFEYKGSSKPKFPADCKSLLSKTLTDEVWNQLKDKKDKCGFSFRAAINSGVENLDSGIGVYAGSADSYVAFAPLFDQIIKLYHGHGPQDKHKSSMDMSELADLKNPDPDGKYIISTRIRVGRNLADYPLGPGISRQQRGDVENVVVKALGNFKGDLSGKYYGLGTMTKDEQKQLIADHFLFKEGDRFLRECGVNRDWPEGRGIFHNNDKTFLVWVNEEDELRIISMQKGADIRQVFDRLSRAANEIETYAKFAYNDHLGYITSCPTNLGTALRASVHIKLPLLGKRKDEFEAIADKYQVQIRGIHGEHSESEGGVYDISNKRRLGLSETQLVRDMYNGVLAMIEREKQLEKGK